MTQGEKKPICGYPSRAAAARAHGISVRALDRRLRSGWPPELALAVPSGADLLEFMQPHFDAYAERYLAAVLARLDASDPPAAERVRELCRTNPRPTMDEIAAAVRPPPPNPESAPTCDAAGHGDDDG